MSELEDLKIKEKELEKQLRDIRGKISDIEIPICEHNTLIAYDIVDCWQCRVCLEIFKIEKYFN